MAAHSSARSKARKRALDILFEAELREADPVATLEERALRQIRRFGSTQRSW